VADIVVADEGIFLIVNAELDLLFGESLRE
jgi:hypothetical protein